MLVIEGIDMNVQLSRQEWEDLLNDRFANKFIMAPDNSLIKPERIGVNISRSNPNHDYDLSLVTGSHVVHCSLEEFISHFKDLPKP